MMPLWGWVVLVNAAAFIVFTINAVDEFNPHKLTRPTRVAVLALGLVAVLVLGALIIGSIEISARVHARRVRRQRSAA